MTTLIIFLYETGDTSPAHWQESVVVKSKEPVDFGELEDSITSYMESTFSDDKEYADMTADIMNNSGHKWYPFGAGNWTINQLHTFYI